MKVVPPVLVANELKPNAAKPPTAPLKVVLPLLLMASVRLAPLASKVPSNRISPPLPRPALPPMAAMVVFAESSVLPVSVMSPPLPELPVFALPPVVLMLRVVIVLPVRSTLPPLPPSVPVPLKLVPVAVIASVSIVFALLSVTLPA